MSGFNPMAKAQGIWLSILLMCLCLSNFWGLELCLWSWTAFNYNFLLKWHRVLVGVFFCLNSLLFSYSVDIIFLVSRKNNRSRWSFTVESFLFLVSQMLIIGIFQAVSWVCSFSFLLAAMADYLAWLCEMAGNIYFWTFPCYFFITFDLIFDVNNSVITLGTSVPLFLVLAHVSGWVKTKPLRPLLSA